MKKCTIKQKSYCVEQDCTVMWLENEKVIITKENEVLAFFPPTEQGYETAMAFVAFMNGGECSFDFVPGKGINIIAQGVFKK